MKLVTNMPEVQIIIPAYNAHKTIIKTLESITIQRVDFEFQVCIVDDNSRNNYDSIVKKFSHFFKLDYFKTPKNVGPGLARQYGIDKTFSKYIVFIDADDYFYSPFSLKNLYEIINQNTADIGITSFIYERDNERKILRNNPTWLHGKIYRRTFLEKNDIRFNNTRANEDNGFNHLIFLLSPKIQLSSDVTYVYQENNESITRKNNRLYRYTGLEWFAYNINWAIEESLKKTENKEKILKLSLGALASLYIHYLELKNEYDISKILKWSKPLKNYYNKYNQLPITNIFKKIIIENKQIKNKNIEYSITFEEFLDRIEEYDD